jgi:hypothetical protein
MSQYIITIVPVVDDGLSTAQTVVRVETVDGALTVKEITVRAPDSAGLVGDEILDVDYDLLLRALSPDASRARSAAGGADRGDPGSPSPAAPPSRRGRPAGRRGAQPHLPPGRAYRRAPEPAELEQVYAETGSIAGVAEHFEVPVHTAQGWVSRLRRRLEQAAD